MAGKLGILAGSGELPLRLIEACRAEGRPYFVLAFAGSCDPLSIQGQPHRFIRLGAGGAGLKILRENGVAELVLAGGVKRPSFAALRPDWRALRFFMKIGLRAMTDFGDDRLFRAIIAELELEGFRIVGAQDILTSLLAPAGVLGTVAPGASAEADIRAGIAAARVYGAKDIGQAVVMRQGAIVDREDADGTDALLRRCAACREAQGGVLVKMAKPQQERRADLPAIGAQTVASAAAAGLKGIAIEAGGCLVLDRAAVVAAADRAGIFVIGVGAPQEPSTAREPMLIYIVAGEPSGDLLGGRLMHALKERTQGRVRFAGIGGETMAAEGLESRVALSELAVMGVLEVLPAARRIFRRVGETVADIQRQKPAALVTIDSSGFTWRIAERLRKAGSTLPIIHYVAPMVWAWRASRAKRMARWYDHLIALLPFEPPYFTAAGLSCAYVGHSVVGSGADKGDGVGFRRRHAIPVDAPLLAMLPGSRRGEVGTLLPIFAAVAQRIADTHPNLRIVVPTTANVADAVENTLASWPLSTIVVRGTAEKYDAFAACNVALAASGTVALELAMAKLPSVITYRINPITHAYVSRVVKVDYANLVNVVLGREAVPELLQYDCTSEKLAAAVTRLLDDKAAASEQIAAGQEALRVLGYGGLSPALRAADEVLAAIARKARPG
jgi:lipid-A-disaccharide synthase